MRRAVVTSGRKLCIGFQEFHYGQFKTTLELIDLGLLGRIHLAEIDYMHGVGPWMRQYWWGRTRQAGGSSMLFCGCHPLMLLMLAMDGTPVEEVMAYDTRSASPHFAALEYSGTQVNLIRFADGRIGKVTSCLDSLSPYYFRCTLIGSEGTLIDTKLNSRKLKGPRSRRLDRTRHPLDQRCGPHHAPDMFSTMFDAIVAHVGLGRPPCPTRASSAPMTCTGSCSHRRNRCGPADPCGSTPSFPRPA